MSITLKGWESPLVAVYAQALGTVDTAELDFIKAAAGAENIGAVFGGVVADNCAEDVAAFPEFI